MDADPKTDRAGAQVAVVRYVFTLYVPRELPPAPPGYELTRLAVLPAHTLNEDVHFPLEQLRQAVDHWLGNGYRRQGLYALARFPLPDRELAEVSSRWDPDLADWQLWVVEPGSNIEAPAAADLLRAEAEAILRREG